MIWIIFVVLFVGFMLGYFKGWNDCFKQWGRAYFEMRQISKNQDKTIQELRAK